MICFPARDTEKPLSGVISLDLQATPMSSELRLLHVSASGPAQMMMVLSPASKVKQWSFGRYVLWLEDRQIKKKCKKALGISKKSIMFSRNQGNFGGKLQLLRCFLFLEFLGIL